MVAYEKSKNLSFSYDNILASPSSTYIEILDSPNSGKILIEELFDVLNLNPRDLQKIFRYGKIKDLIPNQKTNRYGEEMTYNGELTIDAKRNIEELLKGKNVHIPNPPPLYEAPLRK